MADHFAIINKQIFQLIPLGYCACGCGQKTRISKVNYSFRKYRKGVPIKFLNGHNSRIRPGTYWKGGKIKEHGYILVWQPNHPHHDYRGYIREHLLVVEKAIGRILPKGVNIHHVNGKRDDNRPNNLVVCHDNAYHKLLHLRERALKECGHVNWRKCNYCKQWDSPENLFMRPYPQTGIHHLLCSRKYAINRRKNRHSKINTP